MLTTVRGAYKQGKVELTETPAGVEEDTPVLVTFLSTEAAPPAKIPQSLYGVWRGKFPQDFDLDATLNEIRGEWQKEWDEAALNT